MADLTDLTAGEIIDDPQVPPERPASSPLVSPEIQNHKPTANTGDALDKLAAAKTGAPVLDPDVEDPLAKAADEAARKAEEKNRAKPKVEPKAEVKPKVEAAKPPTKPEVEKKPDVEAEKKKADEPKDELSKVELPPYVKPATVTAFEKVKAVAREQITTLKKELETVKAQVPKEGGLTPELKKEVEELRNFRAIHNYRGTPEFVSTYEKPISSNDDVIFEKLKGAGFDDKQIAAIKGIGTAKLDWEPVLKELPPIVRRSIEAKLLENESLTDKRDKALKEAEGKPAEYAKKQAEETAQRTAEDTALLKTTADTIIEQAGLFKIEDIPVSATAEEKSAIEARNKFSAEQKERYETIMADRSPGMVGQLVASTLLAYRYKNENASLKDRADRAEAELAKIKKSSSSRRESAAPSGGPVPKRETSILRDTGSALDALRAEKEASARS